MNQEKIDAELFARLATLMADEGLHLLKLLETGTILECSRTAAVPSVVTCVYCGHEYPDGTPTHKAELLTDHIKVCEKHPMREAEARIVRLRKALVGVIGADSKEGLEALELGVRMAPAPEADKAVMIDAIHALLSEANL